MPGTSSAASSTPASSMSRAKRRAARTSPLAQLAHARTTAAGRRLASGAMMPVLAPKDMRRDEVHWNVAKPTMCLPPVLGRQETRPTMLACAASVSRRELEIAGVPAVSYRMTGTLDQLATWCQDVG